MASPRLLRLLPYALAVFWVLGIDAITNSLDTATYAWDHVHYVGMAEHGLAHDPLVAPFAYRFGSVLPAWVLHHGLGLSVVWSFRLIAWTGAITTLWIVLAWLASAGVDERIATLTMTVVAFSSCHVRFLVFDVYRPDHLAYPLFLLATWALLDGRRGWVIVLGVVGVQVREFLAIPLVGLVVWEAWRGRLAGSLGAFGVTAVAVVLPRWLLDIDGSEQNLDPARVGGLRALIRDPLDPFKTINLAIAVVTYLLPTVMWSTADRWRSWWSEQPPAARLWWPLSTALVLGLALYGGSDYDRFVTYLVALQVGFVAHALPRAGAVEIGLGFLAIVIVNRLGQPFPMDDLGAYLDQFAYANRFTGQSLQRIALLAQVIVGMVVVRYLVARRSS